MADHPALTRIQSTPSLRAASSVAATWREEPRMSSGSSRRIVGPAAGRLSDPRPDSIQAATAPTTSAAASTASHGPRPDRTAPEPSRRPARATTSARRHYELVTGRRRAWPAAGAWPRLAR